MRRLALGAAAFAAVFAILHACGRDGPATPSYDRSQVVVATVRRVIAPAYVEFEERAEALEAATRAWASDPTPANLEATRTAWREARAAWKWTEAFDFGPADDAHVNSNLDFWPAIPDRIEARLAEPRPLDQLGATERGLPVLEYLLFGPAGGDPVRRTAYVVLLAGDVVAQARFLRGAWEGEYGADFATAGSGSRSYPTVESAVVRIVYRMAQLVRKAADLKLGRPLGHRTGGAPQPETVESRFSEGSIADLISNFEGLERLYVDGGLSDLVRTLDPALDARVRAAVGEVLAAVRSIPAPLSRTVESDPEKGEVAFRAVKALEHVLTVDLKGALGLGFEFRDTDGD